MRPMPVDMQATRLGFSPAEGAAARPCLPPLRRAGLVSTLCSPSAGWPAPVPGGPPSGKAAGRREGGALGSRWRQQPSRWHQGSTLAPVEDTPSSSRCMSWGCERVDTLALGRNPRRRSPRGCGMFWDW